MLDDLGVTLRYTHAGSDHQAARPWEELDTSEAARYRRLVFLHRDPRDTVISGYYQVDRRLDGYPGTLSDFLRDPRHGIEKVVRFNALWLRVVRERPDAFAVRYEDLRGDPWGNFTRIVRFVGCDAPAAAIRAVIDDNTFEKMQRREIAGTFDRRYQGRLGTEDPHDPDSLKVRRGQVEGYRSELGAEDLAYCNRVMSSVS